MRSRWPIVLCLIILLLGFLYVQTAGATSPQPGTQEDPLVTRSYVERALQETTASLQEQITYLTAEIRSLEKRIASLEARYAPPVVLTIGSKKAMIGDRVVDLSVAPFTREGRTMLPFRFVGEALGAQVGWEQATKTVSFKLGEREVSLSIGSRVAQVNGEKVNLEIPPQLVQGTTMVPLRFVADSLGARVEWIPEKSQVITYP